MKFDFIQDDFSGGEISPRAQGRVSSELWKIAAARMGNVWPQEEGAFQSRAGFELVQSTANVIGSESDFTSVGQPVKHINVQDTPFGDIVLELVIGSAFAVSLRMLDKDGNVLSWNGALYDFNAPANQIDHGFNPGANPGLGPPLYKSGWYFTNTSLGENFIDPVDNKICFRIPGPGFAQATNCVNIPSSLWHSLPGGSTDTYKFQFTSSGSSVTVTIDDPTGAHVFLTAVCPPGTNVLTFNPRLFSTSYDTRITLTVGSVSGASAANVWGFQLTKDALVYGARLDQLDPTYDPGTGLPSSFLPNTNLNDIQVSSSWIQTSDFDKVIRITPTDPTGSNSTQIFFAARGGSNQGFTWSVLGGSPAGTINSATGQYSLTGYVGNATVDTVKVVDSQGNTATVNVLVTNVGGAPVGALNADVNKVIPGGLVNLVSQIFGSALFGYNPASNLTWSFVNNRSGGSFNPIVSGTSYATVYTAGPNPGVDDIQVVINAPASTVITLTISITVAVPVKIEYFFIILAGMGATPLQLVYKTPQAGDPALKQLWTCAQMRTRVSLYDDPLPNLANADSVVFYGSRLWLGFNDTFGSVLGCAVGPSVNSVDLTFNFGTSKPGPVVASDGINLKLSTPSGQIVWMNVLRGLVLGTTRSEKIFSQGTLAIDPATGQTFSITDESNIGSDKNLSAVDVNDKIAFFNRGRRRLRLAGIDISSNGGLVTEDPSLLGEHLLNARVRSFCYLKGDNPAIVFACDDGTVAVAHLNAARKAMAWSRITLPLNYLAFSACGLDTGKGAYLWIGTTTGQSLRVKTIDSRHAPRLIPDTDPAFDTLNAAPPMLEYDADVSPPIMDGWLRCPVLPINGGTVNQLPVEMRNRKVAVIQLGVFLGFFTPQDNGGANSFIINVGGILPVIGPAGAQVPNEVFVGFPYPEHQLVTLPLEGGNPLGTAQGHKSRIVEAYVRLVESYIPLINGKRAAERAPTDPNDFQASRVTGDVRITQFGFNRNQQVVISQDKPFRIEVSALYGATAMSQK